MKELYLNLSLTAILFFTRLLVCGQVNFHAEISPSVINRDEYTTYTISIENPVDVGEILPPSLNDFSIMSGPDQQMDMTLSGSVKRNLSISFVLKPLRPGKIQIGSAMARIGGRIKKTEPLLLTVKNRYTASASARSSILPGSRPSLSDFNDYIFHKDDKPQAKASKCMHLRLEVSKKVCYIGEPVVVAYKLYTRLKSESRLTRNPSFNGFSVTELQDELSPFPIRAKLEGREYNVYTIRKVQLYPLQAGVFVLQRAELENEVEFIRDEYARQKVEDPFGMYDDFTSALVPPEGLVHALVNLESNADSIKVLPLPENKPPGFHGAVGRFTVHAAIPRKEIRTDENMKLTITVQGTGNMQLMNMPEISWPAGVEPFEPSVKEELNIRTVPISGSKIFEYPFAVANEGNFRFPPVVLDYFDPATGKYEKAVSLPIELHVKKGSHAFFTLDNKNNSKRWGKQTGGRLNDTERIVIASASILLLGMIIFLVRKGRRKRAGVSTVKDLSPFSGGQKDIPKQIDPFQLSEKELFYGSDEGFYKILNAELKSCLCEALGMEAFELTSANLLKVADGKGISNETSLRLLALMKEIEIQLYSPVSLPERKLALLTKAKEIVHDIQVYIFRPR